MLKNNFTTKFGPLIFNSPQEMLLFYDENLRSRRVVLHPWQIELLEYFANPATEASPMLLAVRAANGSGKSQFGIAPCVLWLLRSFDMALGVVTSSSAAQLDTQTERYCRELADRINAVNREAFGEDIFEIVKRRITCIKTNSVCDFFATDEGKKAEGKHPRIPGAEMAIFVDEGKSVEDNIYDALDRCTGFTRRLDISSPGNVRGHFYSICTNKELAYKEIKVTAFDCPHISHSSIEKRIKEHGLHDPLIRSSIFSEFTSIDEQVVIPFEILEGCLRFWDEQEKLGKSLFLKFGVRAGLDLSKGGDESVFSLWDGNKQIFQDAWQYTDTVNTRKRIIELLQNFKNLGLQNPDGTWRVWADDGGIGGGIIDHLKEHGYTVNRVLNQWRAVDKTRYANRGTEMWFVFKRFIEEFQCRPKNDPILLSQLSNRYFNRKDASGLIALESKEKARANGHPSPDRADAAVLAWSPYTFPLDHEMLGLVKPKVNSGERLTEDQLLEYWRKKAYTDQEEHNGIVPAYTEVSAVISQDDVIEAMKSSGDRVQDSVNKIYRRMRRESQIINKN